MPRLADLRSGLGHAVADAADRALARVKPRHLTAIDPRVIAERVAEQVTRDPEVQRALVRWVRSNRDGGIEP